MHCIRRRPESGKIGGPLKSAALFGKNTSNMPNAGPAHKLRYACYAHVLFVQPLASIEIQVIKPGSGKGNPKRRPGTEL